MIVSLFTLLLQAAPASTPSATAGPAQRDAKPVRVWLGSSGSLLRGDRVRVYVQTTEDGYVVVLHRRTDGHIEVLFPANPADDPLVRPGTYEIKRAGDRESFVVEEPDGTGLVLAALSPASYRFDEFVRAASWDPNALAPSWSGADAEGTLADIVQRMLGDGYFNYDFVTYTVAPRFYTMQDTAPQSPFYPSCVGCSFVGVQVIIAEPLFGCDAFFAPCVGVRRFAHRDRFTDSGIRSVDLPMNVIALALGPARTAATARVVPRSPRLVFKPPAGAGPSRPIEPRARAPVAMRAIPLGPGSEGAVAPRRRAAPSYTAPMPGREARLTLTPTPVREEPAGVARANVQLIALPQGSVAPALARPGAAVTTPSGVPLRMAAPFGVQLLARSSVVGGAGATAQLPAAQLPATQLPATQLPPAQLHGMALPGATWRAVGSRGAVVRATGRPR